MFLMDYPYVFKRENHIHSVWRRSWLRYSFPTYTHNTHHRHHTYHAMSCTQPVFTLNKQTNKKGLNHTRIMLAPVFAAYPRIHVLQFGYDILDLQKNALCKSAGLDILPQCHNNASCVNKQFVRIQTGILCCPDPVPVCTLLFLSIEEIWYKNGEGKSTDCHF